MSSLKIFYPASVHEAISLLETSTMPVDSLTRVDTVPALT